MTRIAIAGGTGSLGQTFLTALLTSPANHIIHILTRSPPSPSAITGPNIHYHTISYSSQDPLTTLLTTHAITLLISTITISSPTTSQSQQILLRAAFACPTLTHLIPSEYGFPCTPAILATAPTVWAHWADNAALLHNLPPDRDASLPPLRFLRIQTGWFMDYFGMPHLQETKLTPFPWAVDVQRMKAAVPGTGREIVSMTWTGDLARFVAWLAEHTDQWDGQGWGRGEEVFLVGDDVSFEEVVGWVKGARGRGFEKVVYDGVERLESGQCTTWFEEGERRPENVAWFAMFGLMAARGLMGLLREGRVDTEKLGWRMRTVKEVVEEAWGGR